MKLIFLGAPGAGKGTQAARISAALAIPAISTGDIIRSAIKTGSKLGLEFKSYTDQGKLVPDELVCALVQEPAMCFSTSISSLIDFYNMV